MTGQTPNPLVFVSPRARLAAEREAALALAARERPIFRKSDTGGWRVAGCGLSEGQHVEVTTRGGSVRTVRITRVLSTDEHGVDLALFRDWTDADEAGHLTLQWHIPR